MSDAQPPLPPGGTVLYSGPCLRMPVLRLLGPRVPECADTVPSAVPCHPNASTRRAFTLVELLVVIGIIAVLMGILLPSLANVRKTAQQARSLSNLRQLAMGYTEYHVEHRGALPLGYPPAVIDGRPFTYQLPTGQTIGFPVASRYPWRLLPYVSDAWTMLYNHRDAPPMPEPADAPAAAESKAYTISLNPTYGLNAYFLGGHAGFYGFDADGKPNVNGPAVFRASAVRDPSRQIVLADAVGVGVPGAAVDDGFFVVSPPRRRGVVWTADGKRCVPVTTGAAMGVPQGRNDRGAAVAFLDGHVASLLPGELTDMRLWSPRAQSADWDYNP